MSVGLHQKFDLEILKGMERRFRATLINSLPGVKCLQLIGSRSEQGVLNLAPFNSIVHIGANPGLLGFILRPTTVDRHTWNNIKTSSFFTLNAVTERLRDAAHQSSAKYDAETSEFDAVGLTPHFEESFSAPYVLESPVKVGLQFEEDHFIEANGTRLVVGRVVEILLPPGQPREDGFLDPHILGLVGVCGLNSYHAVGAGVQREYARP